MIIFTFMKYQNQAECVWLSSASQGPRLLRPWAAREEREWLCGMRAIVTRTTRHKAGSAALPLSEREA